MDQDSFDDVQEQSSENIDEILRKFETPNVSNRDNELLHPWGPIGHVDEVNGPGAVEVPEFVPTRHELFQLAKYWTATRLDIDFFWFFYATSGSREIRLGPFADRRISRIADCLGDTLVEQACKEAEDEFAKTVDARAWEVFRHGTPEERAAFQGEVQQKLHETGGGVVNMGGVRAICVPRSELRPMEELVDLRHQGPDGGGDVEKE